MSTRGFIAAGLAALLLSGCDAGAGQHADAGAMTQPELLLSTEDVLTLRSATLATGPSITGSILPGKRADLRAEVAAVVLAVLKENGDVVKRGDLLVRLDDTSIRDTLAAAETSAQTAGQAFEQAQRQYERMVTLRKDGLVSTQQVEDAEVRRNQAQSERESARSALVSARQQLQRTMDRAPFDGVVSDRRVSAGDTAQVGKELIKVIDPGSLRFEGHVSADSIGALEVGQRVTFSVHGYGGQTFTGAIKRLNPAANASTRQVEVLVAFSGDQKLPDVSGLYAEGRIETRSDEGYLLPADMIVRDGDEAFAWRVRDGRLQKVRVKLGDRDPRSGEYRLEQGLVEGDTLIRYPGSSLHDGQAVRLSG